MGTCGGGACVWAGRGHVGGAWGGLGTEVRRSLGSVRKRDSPMVAG